MQPQAGCTASIVTGAFPVFVNWNSALATVSASAGLSSIFVLFHSNAPVFVLVTLLLFRKYPP